MRDRLFSLIIYGAVFFFTLICLVPFWLVFIGSFSTENAFRQQGYSLWPSEFSLDAYRYILSGKQIFNSYFVTIAVTTVGTLLAVLLTASFAYVLANRKVKYRNAMAFFTYFTMIFGSGLVGFYLLIASWLDLKDSFWALVLPYLLNPFYAFIFVSFFRTL